MWQGDPHRWSPSGRECCASQLSDISKSWLVPGVPQWSIREAKASSSGLRRPNTGPCCARSRQSIPSPRAGPRSRSGHANFWSHTRARSSASRLPARGSDTSPVGLRTGNDGGSLEPYAWPRADAGAGSNARARALIPQPPRRAGSARTRQATHSQATSGAASGCRRPRCSRTPSPSPRRSSRTARRARS
jgi:hypothetical protein